VPPNASLHRTAAGAARVTGRFGSQVGEPAREPAFTGRRRRPSQAAGRPIRGWRREAGGIEGRRRGLPLRRPGGAAWRGAGGEPCR